MAVQLATVTASLLNVRSGAGTDFPVIHQLRRNARVEVTSAQGNWLELRWNGKRGYAHKNFLFLPATEPPRGFLRDRQVLRDTPLEASPDRRIMLRGSASGPKKLVAETWNAYGSLLGALCREVGIEAGAGVAVLCVESAGRGFNSDGRLKVRFENHVFWRRWAQEAGNQAVFRLHFRFDARKKWLRHEFRVGRNEEWKPVHRSQAMEWRVLEFARRLDDTQALCSTSMGSPQIMGFQHASVGCQTVQEMFRAFGDPHTGERAQILGLFDFIRGPGTSSPMAAALRRNDFVAFANRYNGPGQAFAYGEKIERYWNLFRESTRRRFCLNSPPP